MKNASKILYYSKYLALALIAFGLLAIVFDSSSGSEIPLLVGLFTLLISTEKASDERSVQIKTTSLYFAFCLSYGLKMITTNLHQNALISFELVEINHFLILTLAISNIVFYSRLYIVKH